MELYKGKDRLAEKVGQVKSGKGKWKWFGAESNGVPEARGARWRGVSGRQQVCMHCRGNDMLEQLLIMMNVFVDDVFFFFVCVAAINILEPHK